MPPLQIFCRKWNIGTDDFVFISLLELLLLLTLILIYFLYVDISESPFKCDINLGQRIIYFGLGLSILCSIILTILLTFISASGTIMDGSRRSGVPYCIYCKIIILLTEIILCIVEFFLSFRYKFNSGNCSKQIFRIYQIVFGSRLICLFIYIFMFWLYYDSLGRATSRHRPNSQLSDTVDLIKKKRVWRRRLRYLLCMLRPTYQEKNTLDDVASVIAMLNKDSDLVCSDYRAGICLMKLEDDQLGDLKGYTLQTFQDGDQSNHSDNVAESDLTIILQDINSSINNSTHVQSHNVTLSQTNPISRVFKSVFTFLSVKSGNSNCTHGSVGCVTENGVEFQRFVENSNNFQNRNLSQSQIERSNDNMSDWRDLRFVYYFATMAKAAYGWPVNCIFRDQNKSTLKFCADVFCRPLNLNCCSKCVWCQNEKLETQKHIIIYPKGNLCIYHRRAIINETNLRKEDLMCISFYNKESYLPFFVAVSHEMKIIILSIRGSFSGQDVLTDLNVNLVDLEEDSLEGCFGHCGMVKSAKKLNDLLFQTDIISNLVKKYKDYRLILTGHSLGAGVAAIMSGLLYRDYPNLKCYAFGIPMGSVNSKMAKYCENFVLTVVNEYDWIPRLSLNSIISTQSRLRDCLLNCRVAKCRVTAAMLGFLKGSITTKTKWNILNVFERESGLEPLERIDVKLPGQIIHIVNLKTLPDFHKTDISNGSKDIFVPIITSSEPFNSFIIRLDIFTNHSPSYYVNRLYSILKQNNRYKARYHHYLKHYWPKDRLEDCMKLPCLEFLGDEEAGTGNLCKRSSLSQNNDDTVYEVINITTAL